MQLGPAVDIRTMTAAQLLARANDPVDTDRDLTALLQRAATLAENEGHHELSLLFSVLSEEPPEVAAGWAPALDEMAARLDRQNRHMLHPTSDPMLARAVSMALMQWKDV